MLIYRARRTSGRWLLALAIVVSLCGLAAASGLPVKPSHPRLLLTPAIMRELLARKNANAPSWLALKARADTLATYTIFPYEYATRTGEPNNTIFYDYQGEGWFNSVLPLAFAYKMTGPVAGKAYLTKLLQIADEMVRAQYDSNNNPPNGFPPLEPDNYYPTRYLGYTIGIIYDWCYDQLGATRKANLIKLMNAYFDDFRANAYQRNSNPDGNYFPGHLICAAAMGYASYGDNPRAQEMIDYARIRFDGTPSALLAMSEIPSEHFDQVFNGGLKPYVALDYNGPNITGRPFLSGFDFQGWGGYGTGTFGRIIDYTLMVLSATGQNLLASNSSWFVRILTGEKQALMPNHFEIDPSGDWGGDQGGVIMRNLPARLAYVLAGSPNGPAAQHFYYSEIADSTYPGVTVFPLSEWEDFFFGNPSRPSAASVLPPYYTAFGPSYPAAKSGDGAVPYFIMRSDSGPGAVWASVRMAAEFYDDHQHYDAGTMTIKRGNDYLLVDASNWKGAAGSTGTLGSSTEALEVASKNSLFFNDFGDYQRTDENFFGGQGAWGIDKVIADEQNQSYTYVRSDLSSAYNRAGDPADEVNRRLDFFNRTFLYLRDAGLFLVFDQVQTKPSANARGQYQKYLRWHVPNVPSIAGRTATVTQGNSRLYLQTLLPAGAALTRVDESTNPDPCRDNPSGTCTPYGADSGTFRVEVRDPANPLFIRFLTLLQPASPSTPAAAAVNLVSNDGRMTGARVESSGRTDVILFNNQSGQVPAPITATSYAFSGSALSFHTLGGMAPGARYDVRFSKGAVLIVENPGGNETASPAGVLRFRLADLGATPTPSPRRTFASTPTPRPSARRTITPRSSRTRTATPRRSQTRTPTARASRTATPRRTSTRTRTPAPTATISAQGGQITFTLDASATRPGRTVYRINAQPGATSQNVSTLLRKLFLGSTQDQRLNISPDGKWMIVETDAAACGGGGCLTLLSGNLTSGAPILAGSPAQPIYPQGIGAVANGGNLVVWEGSKTAGLGTDLFKASRTGPGNPWSAPVRLTAASSFMLNGRPAISSDGATLLFSCGNGSYLGDVGTSICRVNTDGTKFALVLTPAQGPPGSITRAELFSPDLAPDGSIVFEADWSAGAGQLWRVPAGSSIPIKITNAFVNDNSPCVLPDGRIASLWLPMANHELKVMAANGSSYFVLNPAVDVFDIGIGCGGSVTGTSPTPTPHRTFTRTRTPRPSATRTPARTPSRTPTRTRLRTASRTTTRTPTPSPTSSLTGQITYSLDASPANPGRTVYRINARPGAVSQNVSTFLRKLLPGSDSDLRLNISPDGQWMEVETNPSVCSSVGTCLAIVKGNLSAAQVIMAGSPAQPIPPQGIGAVANGGNLVVWEGSKTVGSGTDLFKVSRSTNAGSWSAPVRLTGASSFMLNGQPAISNDDSTLVFGCTNGGSFDINTNICEVKTDGTGFHVVLTPANKPPGYPTGIELTWPDFAPDGSIVFEGDWDSERVWRLPAGSKIAQRVGSFTNDNTPCVLPNGRIASLWLPGAIHELKVMTANGGSYFVLNPNTDVFDVGIGCGAGSVP